jgi:hypothetical protein
VFFARNIALLSEYDGIGKKAKMSWVVQVVELHRILINFGKIFAQWPDPPGNHNFKVQQEDGSSSMVHSSMQIAGQNSVQFNKTGTRGGLSWLKFAQA